MLGSRFPAGRLKLDAIYKSMISLVFAEYVKKIDIRTNFLLPIDVRDMYPETNKPKSRAQTTNDA